MSEERKPEQAEVLAAMIVLHAYQSGAFMADHYDTVERARAVIAAYVPVAIGILEQR
jgi:hypothetical protein